MGYWNDKDFHKKLSPMYFCQVTIIEIPDTMFRKHHK